MIVFTFWTKVSGHPLTEHSTSSILSSPVRCKERNLNQVRPLIILLPVVSVHYLALIQRLKKSPLNFIEWEGGTIASNLEFEIWAYGQR